ncbi:hypothetical protein TKK_0017928 [Trichogramma kaykai]|uniref:Beta-1,4-N-acetylgalactosaminyltransferase n=1 Tax=Trichogramma kaykai TaxID=54128 RepID=A0ABD2W173_9HYME
MTVAASSAVAGVVVPWHRAHIYKVLVCIVLALIALQYLSGAIDRRSIETIFTINTSRPPHQHRTLVIYGTGGSAAAGSEDDMQDESTSNASSSSISISGPRASEASGAKNASSIESSAAGPTSNSKSSSDVNASNNGNNNNNNDDDDDEGSREPPLCPAVPPNLVGPIAVSKSPPDLSAMEKAFARVKQGGRGAPVECRARYRVAIVVPFRDRFPHLMTLLYNLHPLLLRQQLDYQIFVVEQEGTGQFNRAMLMNVGYVEALKERPFDCFVFHDVDLLPEDDRNIYNCPEQPRHMSVAIDKFLYRLPYSDLFGGVSAMTTNHFRMVNGFSNVFWGWGGEDDDMANRIKSRGLHISRYPANIARYKMLTHKKEKANPKRYEFLKSGKKRFLTDGLANLQYEIMVKKRPKLYTWFLVRLTQPAQPS